MSLGTDACGGTTLDARRRTECSVSQREAWSARQLCVRGPERFQSSALALNMGTATGSAYFDPSGLGFIPLGQRHRQHSIFIRGRHFFRVYIIRETEGAAKAPPPD